MFGGSTFGRCGLITCFGKWVYEVCCVVEVEVVVDVEVLDRCLKLTTSLSCNVLFGCCNMLSS